MGTFYDKNNIKKIIYAKTKNIQKKLKKCLTNHSIWDIIKY